MKTAFWFCVLLTVGAGCSKQSPPPVTVEPAPETPAIAKSPALTPAPPQPVRQNPPVAPPAAAPKPRPQLVAGVKPLEGRVDAHMTALLTRFVAQKGRLPDSILELAGATSDGFPLAPAGHIYAIDPATAQVKLVKQ